MASPTRNIAQPEKSCKKPCAVLSPNWFASTAVKVSLMMLTRIAMGAAERKSIHFFALEWLDKYAKAALRVSIEISDRRPEQAVTTSRLVSAK